MLNATVSQLALVGNFIPTETQIALQDGCADTGSLSLQTQDKNNDISMNVGNTAVDDKALDAESQAADHKMLALEDVKRSAQAADEDPAELLALQMVSSEKETRPEIETLVQRELQEPEQEQEKHCPPQFRHEVALQEPTHEKKSKEFRHDDVNKGKVKHEQQNEQDEWEDGEEDGDEDEEEEEEVDEDEEDVEDVSEEEASSSRTNLRESLGKHEDIGQQGPEKHKLTRRRSREILSFSPLSGSETPSSPSVATTPHKPEQRLSTKKRMRRQTLRQVAEELSFHKTAKLPPQLQSVPSTPKTRHKKERDHAIEAETQKFEDKVLAIKKQYRIVVAMGNTAYCWVPGPVVRELGLSTDPLHVDDCTSDIPEVTGMKSVAIPWDHETLSATQASSVDWPAHEGAKTAEDLLEELQSGKSSLGMGRTPIGMKLVKVEVVILVQLQSADGKVLLHTKEQTESLQRLPRFRKKRHETLMEAARRFMSIELALPPCYIIDDLYRTDAVESGVEPDFPGFGLQRKQFVLRAHVEADTDPQVLKLIGLGDASFASFETGCHEFSWVQGDSWLLLHPRCKSRGSELKPVSPWNAQSVQQFCMDSCHTDIAKATKEQQNELVQNLVDGRCAFMSCITAGPRILPVVQAVVMMLHHGGESSAKDNERDETQHAGKDVLVQFSQFSEVYEAHLPWRKVQEDETETEAIEQFLEDLRIPMKALEKIQIKTLQPELRTQNDYPGLPTLYHRTLFVFKVVSDVPGIEFEAGVGSRSCVLRLHQ
eukprot:gnl/MRDRNA2_/MRDRNA2_77214_c0_seq2.p1 gnl/MRDRNA2_/MRDRNA2_77214_c0~~gnl/MRDRNA2_/MRDRNA2_77214_c0_seq2.p1  ORF type:complete len:769 (-),score=181.34 gnl/MRDRNA2_/MRDRNA2_77214_c0_seq2:67-2373(-)